MTKKWIAITLLLFVATGLLGWQLYVSVLRFNTENDLSKIQPVRDIKQKIVQDKSLPRSAPSVNRAPAEFAAVPENNVFSESRTREEKTDGTSSLEPPPLTQKPILVGVSIVDNQKRASIIDPSSPAQGRNRRSQIKRIGDVYRGYTITDIAPNRIILESGSRKEIIPLHEGSKRQQSGKTSILSTRVVSIGGGTVTGGAPVVIIGAGPASGRSGTAPVSASASGTQPAGGYPVGVPQRTPPANVTPTPSPATETDAQGRRIIRTPFGNIVRPNRE
jgi:hypothetical protein